jgi:hypothetical protein
MLEIEYKAVAIPSFGRTEKASNIYVLNRYELSSSIEIPIYDKARELKSSINVRHPDTMPSSISVSRQELASNIIARQSDESLLDASLLVRQRGNPADVATKIAVSRDYIFGSVIITNRSDIESFVTVRRMGLPYPEVSSNIIISKDFIFGSVKVLDRSDIISSIAVRMADVRYDIDASIIVSKPSISGNISVPHRSELDSSITILYRNDLISKVIVSRPFVSSDIYVLYRSDIAGSISVRREGFVHLDSNISISRPQLVSSITLIFASDVESTIAIRKESEEQLSSSVFIIHRNDVPSSIDVIGASSLNGNIFIISGYLRANIKIPTHAYKDLRSKATIRVRWFKDMESSIRIGGIVDDGAYVFIM